MAWRQSLFPFCSRYLPQHRLHSKRNARRNAVSVVLESVLVINIAFQANATIKPAQSGTAKDCNFQK